MKILGIGEAVIDTTSVVDPSSGDILESLVDVGGPVVTALALLAQLGETCHLITSLGSDTGADYIRNQLTERHIAVTDHMRPKTKQNHIVVDARSGQRAKQRGGIEHAPLATLDPAVIQAYDVILMDRHEPHAFYEVVRHKRPDTLLIIDPSTELSPFTMDMMRHATHPIIPIETLAELYSNDLDAALQQLHLICNQPYIVTAGPLGSILYDGTLQCLSAHSVHALDTNGAGDIYRGAVAYGLVQGWNIIECARYANTVAALQCLNRGNMHAVPTQRAIETLHCRPPDTTLTRQMLEQHINELRSLHDQPAHHSRPLRRRINRANRHRHTRSQKAVRRLLAR